MTYRADVKYLDDMRPDQVTMAADELRRVVRVLEPNLDALRHLSGRVEWDGGTRDLYDLRLNQATEIDDALRTGFVQAGHALDDYAAAQRTAQHHVADGKTAEDELARLIQPIAERQWDYVPGTDTLREWEDLRAGTGFWDSLDEWFQKDDINRIRARAETLHANANKAYNEGIRAELDARRLVVDRLNQARTALPDFLASATDALKIIDRTPGLREAILQAANDPNTRRPTGALEFYQVMDDPDSPPFLSPTAMGASLSGLSLTASEAAILRELSDQDKLKFIEIRKEALAAGNAAYPSVDGNDDHNDAFRHTYWNARLTQEFGADFAERFTTAHEALPVNQGPREAMDLHNNEIGRQIALAHPHATPEELKQLVGDAVRRGDTVVIGQQGQLVYTDHIRPEDTIDTATLNATGKPLPGHIPVPQAKEPN
jgi:hypothetical protein